MSDADPSASEESTPARPTTPRLSGRPISGLSGARPARPRHEPAKVEPVDETEIAAIKEAGEEPPEAFVIAETVVVAPPPPEPAPPAPPRLVTFGSPFLRQTLFPPCLVLAIGSIAIGVGYFLQPADAALRQITPAVPVTLLALGIACAGAAAALARSLRPIDSGRPHS